MHARMASGLLLALGIADLAVLNLLLAPRLCEMGRAASARQAVVAERLPPLAAPPPAPPSPTCPPPVAPVGASLNGGDAAGSREAVDNGGDPHTPAPAVPDITFELGEVGVPGWRAADVRRVAEALRPPSEKRLLLRGHADRLGLPETNLGLSRRRAEAVLRLLMAFGAPANRVEIEALGAADPVAGDDNPRGWAKNRRVQLLWR